MNVKRTHILNLLGIALTLAGVFVLLTQTVYGLHYNRCIPDYRNVYRVEVKGAGASDRWEAALSRPLVERMAGLPVVEDIACALWQTVDGILDKDGTDIGCALVYGNGRMLTVLGAQCVDGRLDLSEGDNGKMVIPASLARKYFGREDVAGEQIKAKGGSSYTVAGVYRDFPRNCLAGNGIYLHYGDWYKGNIYQRNFNAYVRFKDGTPRKAMEQTLRELYIRDRVENYMDKGPEELTADERVEADRMDCRPVPIGETYFSGHDEYMDKGNRSVLYMQELAIVLLLLICAANYANYSMAQAPGRIRPLTIRKVMGAQTWRLRLGLLAEGMRAGIVAWAVAMAAMFLIGMQPEAQGLFTDSISPADHPQIAASLLVVAVAIGAVSTMYSAWYATSFAPVTTMKGNVGLSPGGTALRQWLVGLQLCTAMVMVVFMGVIQSQTYYIYHSAYGYDKDSVLLFPLGDIPMEKKAVLRQELEKLPGVAMASFSHKAPSEADRGMEWTLEESEPQYQFRVFLVDWKFLRTYGIRVVEGRDFKEGDSDVYIFNKTMKDRYPGIEVGRPLFDGDMEVVGICDNIRAGSTRIDNSQTALAFVIQGEKKGDPCRSACVRLAPGADIRQTRHEIEQVLDGLTEGARPDLTFLDDRLEQTYQEENNFIRQMRIAAGLMLAITLIGVFCLTMFETEYRRKEIAIRKVMGSTVREVLLLFVARYTAPLAVSFVLATPLAYWLGTRWLENFAEHAPVHWWLFPAALVAVSAVVTATVVLQSWRVATSNPINSIKTE